MSIRLLLLVCLLAGFPRLAPAQTVDPTFAIIGFTPTGTVFDVKVQSNGKIVVAGGFNEVGGVARPGIARLNADGTLDTTFVPPFTSGESYAIVLQPPDKIIAAGLFVGSGLNGWAVVRLNADGSHDTTYAGAAGSSERVLTMKAASADRVVAAGSFSSLAGSARSKIARLNANGGADPGFVPATITNQIIRIAVQSDDKVIIGGDFSAIGSTLLTRLARLDAAGALDPGFTPPADGFGNGMINTALALRGDGALWVGAQGTIACGGIDAVCLRRLLGTGASDPSWTTLAFNISAQVSAILPLTDNGALIGGAFTSVGGNPRTALARVSAAGAVDPAFGINISWSGAAPAQILAMTLQPDGKLLIAGQFDNVGGMSTPLLARLDLPDLLFRDGFE